MTTNLSKLRRGVHWRALISFLAAIAFLLAAGSGIVLYLTPRGWLANWGDWSILGLSKAQWVALHMNACLLLLLAIAAHVCWNLRPLWHYLKRASTGRGRCLLELAGACLIGTLLLAGTLGGLPLFSSVTSAREQIRDGWLTDARPGAQGLARRAAEAPRDAHAHGLNQPQRYGQMTLDEFSRDRGVEVHEVLRRLNDAGVDASARTRLREVADRLQMAPRDVVRWLGSSV